MFGGVDGEWLEKALPALGARRTPVTLPPSASRPVVSARPLLRSSRPARSSLPFAPCRPSALDHALAAPAAVARPPRAARSTPHPRSARRSPRLLTCAGRWAHAGRPASLRPTAARPSPPSGPCPASPQDQTLAARADGSWPPPPARSAPPHRSARGSARGAGACRIRGTAVLRRRLAARACGPWPYPPRHISSQPCGPSVISVPPPHPPRPNRPPRHSPHLDAGCRPSASAADPDGQAAKYGRWRSLWPSSRVPSAELAFDLLHYCKEAEPVEGWWEEADFDLFLERREEPESVEKGCSAGRWQMSTATFPTSCPSPWLPRSCGCSAIC